MVSKDFSTKLFNLNNLPAAVIPAAVTISGDPGYIDLRPVLVGSVAGNAVTPLANGLELGTFADASGSCSIANAFGTSPVNFN